MLLDYILLWNYCLSVYLVGMTRQDKARQDNYKRGTWIFLVLEFWYLLLVLIMFILIWVHTYSLWFWVMSSFVSLFVLHAVIKKWVNKRFKIMHIEQQYEQLSNKITKAWMCFSFLVLCWLSFIIVAFTFFVG